MLTAIRKLEMTHRSICLPAAEMEGKSAPQIPARRTNERESSLNDALAVRGSIRAATSRNINRALMHVVDHEPNPAHGFERGPTDYKSGGLKIGQISRESGPVGRHCRAGSSIFAMEIGIVRANRDQSPISRRCSHWRKSPLKPMLSAT
jgi:hypothetical protein